jgi:3-methyladenine DNA glycosylase AlkC
MKKSLLLMTVLLGSVAALRRLRPAERRAQLLGSLSQMPVSMMERCMNSLPENSPRKTMMSGLRRIEEQNEELLALSREQKELLRKQYDLLSAVLESPASGDTPQHG